VTAWRVSTPFGPDAVRLALAAWPAADWPGWVACEHSGGGKRMSDLLTPLPPALAALLAGMACCRPARRVGIPGAVADLSLWGAGLHETSPGGHLAPHRDADTHARLGLRRAWSASLYVSGRWEPSWGGRLVLHLPGGPVKIDPLPGRLVVFDCREVLHEVEPYLPDAACPRRSLALFGYLPEPGPGARPRAEFRHG
jgi:hypothetical protein